MPKKLSKSSLVPASPTTTTTTTTASSALPSSTSIPDLSALPASFASSSADAPLPKLVVFDLDYTLWPFWIDTHATPPLKPANAAHSAACDRHGEDFAFYDDVPAILTALPRAGMRTAVASRTSAPGLARDLLKMLHIPRQPASSSLTNGGGGGGRGGPETNGAGGKPLRAVDTFDGVLEMYPSSKIRHFEAIHKKTGVRYEDMLFFDDEPRNRETEKLGVTMWLVRDGVSWHEIEKGVAEWRKRRGYGKR